MKLHRGALLYFRQGMIRFCNKWMDKYLLPGEASAVLLPCHRGLLVQQGFNELDCLRNQTIARWTYGWFEEAWKCSESSGKGNGNA